MSGIFAWEKFSVGDRVTRDGTDVHRVVWVNDDGGQTIEVECEHPPETGWAAIGEREYNMARRYSRLLRRQLGCPV